MYTIELDRKTKFVFIEARGVATIEELNMYKKDIMNIIDMYNQGELSFLITVDRLDLLSQEITVDAREILELEIIHAKKMAIVYGNRTVFRMQTDRLVRESLLRINLDMEVRSFTNRQEAMRYLSYD